MRIRKQFLFILPLVCSLAGRPVSAGTDMVLQISSNVQGNIAGESVVPGHTTWIDVLSYSLGVNVPIGANGVPTGPARPSEVNLMKAFDRSSIKLLSATSGNEQLTCTMEFQNTANNVVYYRIALAGAHIISLQQSGSSEEPTESVSLAYSTITFTDVLQGISVVYSWNAGGSAGTTPGELAKGILLPPAPNPTRGATQFRFSLPKEGDAELTLFDMQGRLVRELHHGWTSGQSVIKAWDGTDDRGVKVEPGVYMARLAYPGAVVTQRFSVVR